MFITKLKIAAAIVLAVTALGMGAGLAAQSVLADVVVNSLLAAFPEEVCFCEFLGSWRSW